MKRRKTILFCMAAVFYLLCACAKEPDSKNKDNKEKETTIQQEAYYYEYEEQRIYIGQKIEEATAVLGNHYEYFEAPSCAAQGMDMFYYYQNFTVRANEIEGEKVVTEIYFKNDTVATPEGIRINSVYADVIGKYGSEYEMNGTAMEYLRSGMRLVIDMKDGKVAGIAYKHAQVG